MKFVDVKNDVAFRKIFGNENRKEVLISFLNAVLMLGEKHCIADVSIVDPYLLPEIKGGKVTIVDVKARDVGGRTFIVEMQVAEAADLDKRVLYYASKSYAAQIQGGEDYEKLKPVYFIGIIDFEVTKNPSYLNRHKITDQATGEHFLQDISFNFIELPKFDLRADELTTIVEQWVFFIKNAKNLTVVPDNVRDEGLKKAYQDADRHNWTQAELDAYDYVLMREQDYRSRMKLDISRSEQQLVRKIASSLKEKGIPNDVIRETTGLSDEEIREL